MLKLALLFFTISPLFADIQKPYLMTADVPVLINGEVADKKDYPATIWIGNCTASVVGPRSVYTAAHCVNASIGFSLGTGRFTAQCIVAPEYRGNPTADYALCYTGREVPGIPYENVNIDPAHVVKGDWILQSGYGCTKWGTRLDGQLRVGKAQVLSTPKGTDNDYATGNGAVLCSGDSGGPAWSLDENEERDKLISINSRSNTKDESYLSAIATDAGIKFTKAYIARFKTPICGVSEDATGCRSKKPKEPVSFEVVGKQVKLSVTWNPSAKYSPEDAKKMLDQSIKALEKRKP